MDTSKNKLNLGQTFTNNTNKVKTIYIIYFNDFGLQQTKTESLLPGESITKNCYLTQILIPS